jgi:hypothetical protein
MSAKILPAPVIPVVKAAQSLPQTATGTLFTVTGTVKVTGLLGRVNTSLGATVTTLSLGYTGTTAGIATATAVTSAASGTLLLPGVPTTAAPQTPVALVVAKFYFTQAGDPTFLLAPFIIGDTAITATTSANDTGTVDWYLWYIPVSSGASVS